MSDVTIHKIWQLESGKPLKNVFFGMDEKFTRLDFRDLHLVHFVDAQNEILDSHDYTIQDDYIYFLDPTGIKLYYHTEEDLQLLFRIARLGSEELVIRLGQGTGETLNPQSEYMELQYRAVQ